MWASKGHRTAGFSLLEVMIAVTILAGIIASFGLATMKAQDAHRVASARSDLDTRAHRILDGIVATLDEAGLETFDPVSPRGDSSLEFCRAAGYSGIVDWELEERLELRLEAGELDNGLDDDGDGLVDEGVIVRTLDVDEPTERDVVLGRWVRGLAAGELRNGVDDNDNGLIDESGFFFQLVGDSSVLRVHVTLERPDGAGATIVSTAETSVRIRN